MARPDWQLPAGVSRSLWEFAHDPRVARDEDRHLADSLLLEFDRQTLARWLPQPGRVLDLGCGTGRLLTDFAARGWSATGVDLSEESLRVAQERAEAAAVKVTLLRANLCDLQCLASDSFDAALLMFATLGMVSGATSRQSVVLHAHRLLKPGGLLALHVHNLWRHLFLAQGRRWLLRDAWRRILRDPDAGDTYHDYRGIPQMFHHVFTFTELATLLRQNDFEIREVIALAPQRPPGEVQRDGADLACRGWLARLRATGWLVLARRRPHG